MIYPKTAPNIREPVSLFTGPFSATLWPRAARAKGPGQGKPCSARAARALTGREVFCPNIQPRAHARLTGLLLTTAPRAKRFLKFKKSLPDVVWPAAFQAQKEIRDAHRLAWFLLALGARKAKRRERRAEPSKHRPSIRKSKICGLTSSIINQGERERGERVHLTRCWWPRAARAKGSG